MKKKRDANVFARPFANEFACPFCGCDVWLYIEECAIVHSPACAEFMKNESPVAFMRAVNAKLAQRKALPS